MGVLTGYTAWMVVLIVAHYALPGLRAETWALIGASGLLAIVAGVVIHRPARKAPWVLLMLANLCALAGQLSQITVTHAALENGPIPSFDDPLYLSEYPLYIAALVLLIRSIGPLRDRRNTADALIMTIGLGLLAWIFLIRPYEVSPTHSTLHKILEIAYLVGNVLILGTMIRLLTPGTAHGRPLWLLVAGALGALISDVATGLIQVYGTFGGDMVVGLGWAACYAAWGAAALDPGMTEVGEPPGRHDRHPPRQLEISRGISAALLLTALIAPFFLFMRAFSRRDIVEGVLAACCVVLFVLVFARLRDVNVSHRQALTRERTLRVAAASLARAGTVEDIGAAAREAARYLMGRRSRREALLAVRADDALRVVATVCGAQAPPTSFPELAAAWLPRLRLLRSTDPRFVPARDLDPAERAAAEQAGYAGILLCPLSLTDRPTGDPLIGVLAVFGDEVLTSIAGSLGILASQIALALERVMLTQEVVQRRGEELFRTLVQDASDAILILNEDGTVRYATPSAKDLYGDVPIEGVNANELIADHERLRPYRPTNRANGHPEEDPYTGLWRFKRHDGRIILAEVRFSDRRDDPTVGGLVVTTRDVTEQHELEEELKHRAFHDALTGLPNRLLFAHRAAHGLALAQRTGTTVAVLFVDLDDFKVVNDTMGHEVGDELLAAVGRRLAAVTRESDTAARLGGDEFALLIENLADATAVEPFANRVVAAFAQPFDLSTGSVLATATVGVATTEDSSDVGELLRHADLSLYAAKSEGKRRWHHYVPTLSAGMVRRREMQAALEETVANSALALAYQPIVTLTTGEIRGFEALARWPDPTRGLVPPSEFIELAEETGLIVPLGSWVMQKAVGDLARWRDPEPDSCQPVVSVNVSARQFRDPDFVARVRKHLDDTGLVPSALMLELTESALLRRDERIHSDLAELKHIGVRLAIDDFGTGYSSLSYLRELPIDVLKMDKAFVDAITDEGRGRAFAELIVDCARKLEIDVIAEGIETEEQRQILATMGCKYGQGYLLARPMEWREAEVLLRSGHALASRLL